MPRVTQISFIDVVRYNKAKALYKYTGFKQLYVRDFTTKLTGCTLEVEPHQIPALVQKLSDITKISRKYIQVYLETEV